MINKQIKKKTLKQIIVKISKNVGLSNKGEYDVLKNISKP